MTMPWEDYQVEQKPPIQPSQIPTSVDVSVKETAPWEDFDKVDIPEPPEISDTPIADKYDPNATINRTIDILGGTAETAATLVTGTIAGVGGFLAGALADPFVGGEISKEWEDALKDKFTFQPTTKSGKGAVELIGKVGEILGIPRKIATALGGESYGRVGEALTIGLLPKAPKVARSIRNVPVKAGEFFYRKTLRPKGTVVESAEATRTGFQGKFWVSDKGLKRFQEVKGQFDRTLNQIKAKYKDRKIPQNEIIEPLGKDLMRYAEHSETPIANMRAVEKMINERKQIWNKKYPDGQIPFSEVQELKTTLYQRYSKSYGETKKAMADEFAKSLAKTSKESLTNIAPELEMINPYEKKLISFHEELDHAIASAKNEKFTITNTIANNNVLMTKLAQLFRSISPDHLLGNPAKLKAYLRDIPSATIGEVLENARLQIEWTPQMGMGADPSGRVASPQTLPPIPRPTTKALPAPSDIKLGMTDISGVPKPTQYTSTEWVKIKEMLTKKIAEPDFIKKNPTAYKIAAELKTKTKITASDINRLIHRIQGKLPLERKTGTPLKSPPSRRGQ